MAEPDAVRVQCRVGRTPRQRPAGLGPARNIRRLGRSKHSPPQPSVRSCCLWQMAMIGGGACQGRFEPGLRRDSGETGSQTGRSPRCGLPLVLRQPTGLSPQAHCRRLESHSSQIEKPPRAGARYGSRTGRSPRCGLPVSLRQRPTLSPRAHCRRFDSRLVPD